MKFWTFIQNNSGGYFVENDEYGICEFVIIEAETFEDAWDRLWLIGDNVDGFCDVCSCCGERWTTYNRNGTDVPMVYNEPLSKVKKTCFRNRAFVHYHDGSFKEFIFKKG